MLRWERDQNPYQMIPTAVAPIPECSGGSEIKTASVPRLSAWVGYQNAPVGARSKPVSNDTNGRRTDTRMLRGERDQNSQRPEAVGVGGIPECSGGSEIKTRIK